jgi:tRNA (guanine37-N1)-methyltransferase
MEVPEILLSGDHAKVDRWRLEQMIERTRLRRPDLLEPGAPAESSGSTPAGEQHPPE